MVGVGVGTGVGVGVGVGAGVGVAQRSGRRSASAWARRRDGIGCGVAVATGMPSIGAGTHGNAELAETGIGLPVNRPMNGVIGWKPQVRVTLAGAPMLVPLLNVGAGTGWRGCS
jgi:hypothetical protein